MNKNIQKLTYSALYLAIALVLPFLTGQIPADWLHALPDAHPRPALRIRLRLGLGLAVGFIAPLLRSVLFGMTDMFPTAVSMAFELAYTVPPRVRCTALCPGKPSASTCPSSSP